MASEVSICNLALSRLGDSATVASLDPPEGSAQAERCATFYSLARDTLLELHNWTFATRRAVLALTAEDSFEWAFAYAAPAGAVKILSVLPYGAAIADPSQDYAIEGGEQSKLILTNQESAVVRYVALVTDTTRFSPLFADALAWLLASYLAGPIIKGDAGMAMGKACYQTFLLTMGQAKTSDANQCQGRPASSPEWIKGR